MKQDENWREKFYYVTNIELMQEIKKGKSKYLNEAKAELQKRLDAGKTGNPYYCPAEEI